MKKLIELYWAFFKIGLFTIGGGYAMLPLMEREAVDNHKWVTREEMLDIYTLSQCTPGVIAVNTATFIGKQEKGVLGAIAGTIGVITPSLVIISIIAAFFTSFSDNPYVIHAFAGIRCAVAALMVHFVIGMIKKKSISNPIQIGILLASFITVAFLKVSPIIVIVVAGVLGFLLFDARAKEEKANE